MHFFLPTPPPSSTPLTTSWTSWRLGPPSWTGATLRSSARPVMRTGSWMAERQLWWKLPGGGGGWDGMGWDGRWVGGECWWLKNPKANHRFGCFWNPVNHGINYHINWCRISEASTVLAGAWCCCVVFCVKDLLFCLVTSPPKSRWKPEFHPRNERENHLPNLHFWVSADSFWECIEW